MPRTIPKTGSVHFALFWLGIWWTKLNRVWGLSPVLWLTSKSVGNFSPISLGKIDLSRLFRRCPCRFSSNQWKNQHKFVENLSMKRVKFQDGPRRQMEIERGYLSGGLKGSLSLDNCRRPQGSSQKIDWILLFCCLFVRKSLEKPSKGNKKGWKAEFIVAERVVESYPTTVRHKTHFRNLTIAEK